MNWLQRFFGDKNKVNDQNQLTKVDYVQITKDWNAHSVSPKIELQVINSNLIMTIIVNDYVFEGFDEGDKASILFKSCSKYSLNTCNDEGYYYGQYRTNPNELPWGGFYEIKSGLDREFPEPIVNLTMENSNKRHFIFFFKDETFECLADDYEIDFIRRAGIKTNA